MSVLVLIERRNEAENPPPSNMQATLRITVDAVDVASQASEFGPVILASAIKLTHCSQPLPDKLPFLTTSNCPSSSACR